MLKSTRRISCIIRLLVGFVGLQSATASVITQSELSELNVQHEKELNVDPDIDRLSKLESEYTGVSLPALDQRSKFKGAVERVSKMKYKHSSLSSKKKASLTKNRT